MGANDKVAATFHPGQAPRAENNPIIMAIEALERMTDELIDTHRGEDIHTAIMDDYHLVRDQLDRIRGLEQDRLQYDLHMAHAHQGGW